MNEKSVFKTAMEIGTLSGQLTPSNQHFVLNTINALLYSQTINDNEKPVQNEPKKTA